MSTLTAAGVLPSPGIVCMSPHSATSQPAPVYARRSRTVTVKPVGALRERRVVGEGQMRLGHADRELVEAGFVELLDLLACGGQKRDPVGAVDPLGDRLDLGFDRVVERVDAVEVRRLLGCGDDRLGERGGALAALDDRVVRFGGERAVLERELPDQFDLVVGVGRERG